MSLNVEQTHNVEKDKLANKLRLVVLFGGRSAEHDVSCLSARHVMAAVDRQKYLIEPIGITRTGRWVQALEANEALSDAPEKLGEKLSATGPEIDPFAALTSSQAWSLQQDAAPDCVVLPILHGPMGEDGTVQGLLELAQVPYVGASVLASALCMDKAAAKPALAAAGLPQTRWMSFALDDPNISDSQLDDIINAAVDYLGLPVFIKPASMGSSIGVTKATNRSEIVAGLRLACRYDHSIIAEQHCVAREIEVAVLGNEILEVSMPGEIVTETDFYDYANKYGDGAKLLVPAPLTDPENAACVDLARKACWALGVEGLARVDFFYEDGRHGRGDRGWLVNELNTMPGFTPISMYPKLWAVSGLPYPRLIDRLVELALQRYQRRQRHSSTDAPAHTP